MKGCRMSTTRTHAKSPPIEEIRNTFAQLPRLRDATINKALAAAGKALRPEQKAEMSAALDNAFSTYLRDRIWQFWATATPASAVVKQLAQMARAADRLVNVLGAHKGVESMPKQARLILFREAEFLGEEIEGYADLPPMSFVAVEGDDGKKMRRMWYQGETQARRCIDGLLMLQGFLHCALRLRAQ